MSQSRQVSMFRAIDPSLLWGAIGTAVFYVIVLLIPAMHDTFWHRYTTEHFVEYIIVAVFAWGLADVALKVKGFPVERMALRHDWLPSKQGREPLSNAAAMLDRIRKQPRWLQESKIGKRLIAALSYVTDRGTSDEFDKHLEYLAEQDEDHTHGTYSVIRFVMGVSPVLGFLGTVLHFGSALSGNSLDELADRLPTVVSEMGEAFNTTTVALASAMAMTFALFACERIERGTQRAVDRFVSRELLNRFEVKDPAVVPFIGSLEAAHHEALAAINKNIQSQVELWSRALDTVFKRFEQRQQQELQSWQVALDVLQQRHEAADLHLETRLSQSVALVDAKQTQHLNHIQGMLDRALALRDDVGLLTNALNGLAHGEGALVEQQRLLTDNLQLLHESHQFEDALHSLTAAMHLMTARHAQPAKREAA